MLKNLPVKIQKKVQSDHFPVVAWLSEKKTVIFFTERNNHEMNESEKNHGAPATNSPSPAEMAATAESASLETNVNEVTVSSNEENTSQMLQDESSKVKDMI